MEILKNGSPENLEIDGVFYIVSLDEDGNIIIETKAYEEVTKFLTSFYVPTKNPIDADKYYPKKCGYGIDESSAGNFDVFFYIGESKGKSRNFSTEEEALKFIRWKAMQDIIGVFDDSMIKKAFMTLEALTDHLDVMQTSENTWGNNELKMSAFLQYRIDNKIDSCVFDDFQDMKEVPEEFRHDVKVWSLSDES